MIGRDNTPYDGRFVFIRLGHCHGLWDGFGSARALQSPWAHDYPRADVHFMKILEEITLLKPRMDGSNILPLDHPDLFQFPFAYTSEPGFLAALGGGSRGAAGVSGQGWIRDLR